LRGLHDRVPRRVRTLIARGQRAGVFRTDLPKEWLATTTLSLMHAAEDVAAGRLDPDDTASAVNATLTAAFTPLCIRGSSAAHGRWRIR